MDFLAAAFSSVLSIIFFCMIVAGVLKLFQVATTLGEIKDLLQKQHVPGGYIVPEASPASPYVSALAYKGPDSDAVPSALVSSHTPTSTPWVSSSVTTPHSGFSPDPPLSGEAMLRALDLEMRLEEAGPTPHFVDTTSVPVDHHDK
jgi:hypothetical protein